MNQVKVVCYGEVLWDNFKDGRRPGGAPMNVSYHLNKMGINSLLITAVGNDSDGQNLLLEIDSLGIDSSFCQIAPGLQTSVVKVNLSADNSVSYDIVENVAWDTISGNLAMENLVSTADALVFGSLAARSVASKTTLLTLIDLCRYRIFDVNLRAPYFTYETVFSLLEKSNLLKLNEDELSTIAQWIGAETADERLQLANIQSRFPNIEKIILTKGAAGASCYTMDSYQTINALNVDVKDTVGSGDSFLAAFLAAELMGKSSSEALSEAILLSGFIASQPGACPRYTLADLLSFKEQMIG